MYILIPTSVLLTDFKIKELNGYKEFYGCYWIYSFGTDRQCWTERCSFCVVPGDLCCYFGGESGHDLPNPNHPQAPHAHVLFPQLPSSVDACYSSVIAPKLLISFLVVRQTISFSACIVQHLFFGVFITTEGFLLSTMAYDCYVAIVNPLLYAAAMSKRKSVGLVIGSLIGGMINSLTHTISFGRLSFCRSKSSVTSSVMSPHCWSCHVLIPPWTSCCS